MINKNMDKDIESKKETPEQKKNVDFVTGLAIDRIVIKDKTADKEILNRRG